MLIAAMSAPCVFCASANADDIIKVRVSYKVVVNPVDGTRPPGVNDADIDAAVEGMNAIMETFGRGYRFVRTGALIDIGGIGGFFRPNPSYYYGNGFADTQDRANIESDAVANKSLYAWNDNAINLFVISGGGISFDIGGNEPGQALIVISSGADAKGKTAIHEIGHYMGLCHTQGCSCGSCAGGGCIIPEDDRISDTLPDLECWDQDLIATFNFGVGYSSLTPGQQTRVDNVFFNVMSYHGEDQAGDNYHTRETELQLDEWVDKASSSHAADCDGITYFVDATNNGIQTGTSELPLRTVAKGLNFANGGGNIVLVRPGNYPENLHITSPVTLRVPRTGKVTIGSHH